MAAGIRSHGGMAAMAAQAQRPRRITASSPGEVYGSSPGEEAAVFGRGLCGHSRGEISAAHRPDLNRRRSRRASGWGGWAGRRCIRPCAGELLRRDGSGPCGGRCPDQRPSRPCVVRCQTDGNPRPPVRGASQTERPLFLYRISSGWRGPLRRRLHRTGWPGAVRRQRTTQTGRGRWWQRPPQDQAGCRPGSSSQHRAGQPSWRVTLLPKAFPSTGYDQHGPRP